VASQVAQSWARLARAAGINVEDPGEPTGCCPAVTEHTPAGTPFTVHHPGCLGLEQRLVGAVLATPTDTEREMEQLEQRIASLSRARRLLLGRLRDLANDWARRAAHPMATLAGVDHDLGASSAWGNAAAELSFELDHNRPGVCPVTITAIQVGEGPAGTLRCVRAEDHPGNHRTQDGCEFRERAR
jgi:hypothetical protein